MGERGGGAVRGVVVGRWRGGRSGVWVDEGAGRGGGRVHWGERKGEEGDGVSAGT